MRIPKVTVVIIVFNDVDRISIAIESAMRQTLRDIEIVVCDHGSTDGTAEVIRRYCDIDERIRLVSLPDNDGEPGRPLNAGIDSALGDWITVMGSDDELEVDACRYMLSFAELKSPDVVLGKVSRVHVDQKNSVTYWHHRLFRSELFLPRIEEAPEYLSDTISAGKLYRRKFLNDNAIRFPEDILYEDQLFTLQAYHRAQGLQILPEPVYKWYIRPKAKKKSITNSRNAIKNFEDRIEVNRRIDEYLNTADSPELHQYKSEKFIVHDLNIYLDNLEKQEESYRDKFGKLSQEYLSAIQLKGELKIHPMLKVIVGLLKSGDVDAAVAAHRFRQGRAPQPVELTSWNGRKYWLSREEIEHSGLDPVWFDVTALGIHLMPFSKRKLSIASNAIDIEGSQLALDLVIGDNGRSLDTDIDSVELVFRRRRDRLEFLSPLSWKVTTPTQVTVTGLVELADAVGPERKFHEIWDLWLKVTRRGVPKILRVPAPGDCVGGSVVDLSGPSRLAGNQLRVFVTKPGNFSFRVEQSDRVANAIAWRVAKTSRKLRKFKSRAQVPLDTVRNSALGNNAVQASSKLVGHIGSKREVKRNHVLFESYQGRQYSDSPRAISEHLHDVCPDLVQYWSYRYKRTLMEFPDYVKPVKFGSIEYHLVAARAGYWVDNYGIGPTVRKHPDTKYLQTWHGVPLKRLFFDSPKVIQSSAEAKRMYADNISRWDYLVSQGKYFEDTFVRSTNSSAELIRSGSPRTDLLLALTAEDRDLIKQRMGLPLNRKIILYMPTYRGRASLSPNYSSIDFRLLSERLQEDWFVLTREHYYRKPKKIARDLEAFVKDVSRYPRPEELMMIADVLITDFSSAMFDYSVLERPMVFHVPDLNDYEQVAPRTYVSLESIAPGPICESEDDVAAAIEQLDGSHHDAVERSARFRRKFMALDDGKSTARVVHRIWGEH